MAKIDPTPNMADKSVAHKVLAVTLFRELQSPDFRYDHKLMLAVITNRAAKSGNSLACECLKKWQFSYWNRFWDGTVLTLTMSKLDSEYKKVPATFIEFMMEEHRTPTTGATTINHFYCPAAMNPKFSVPGWARGKEPVYVTRKFRYYAL